MTRVSLLPLTAFLGVCCLAAIVNGVNFDDPADVCRLQQEQYDALMVIYNSWIKGTSSPLNSPSSGWANGTRPVCPHPPGSSDVPNFCRWKGVLCAGQLNCNNTMTFVTPCANGTVTSLRLDKSALRGSINVGNRTWQALAPTLKTLRIPDNILTGTIPVGLQLLSGLQDLELGNNMLRGTVPDMFTTFTYLYNLDLSANYLSGPLPQLCAVPAWESNNWTYYMGLSMQLGSNALTGAVDMSHCPFLRSIDVTGNQFTSYRFMPNWTDEEFPNQNYPLLANVRARHNSLMGDLAAQLSMFKFTNILDVGYNQLTGTIPDSLADMPNLAIFNIEHNALAGSLPDNIFTLHNMAILDVSNNNLSGITPFPTSDAMMSLQRMDLSANPLLGGALPYQSPYLLGLALLDSTLDFSNTSMCCCGEGGYDAETGRYGSVNYSLPLFPPYVEQDYSTFAEDVEVSFLACPSLMFNLTPEAAQFLPNNSFARNPNNTKPNLSPLKWTFSAKYYLFQGCQCIQGYHMVNETSSYGFNINVTCVANSNEEWYQEHPWILAIIIVFGLLLLLALTAPLAPYLCCAPTRGGRPILIQSFINMRKRLKGEPRGCLVTVVVTDIEGYSDLMKRDPEQMTKALQIHDSVLREARWSNFGYTVEQEGDSFTLAFYDAFDAAAFCLQAQLLLMDQTWPAGLTNDDTKQGAKEVPSDVASQPSRPNLITPSSLWNKSVSSVLGSKSDLNSPLGPSALPPAPAKLFSGPRVRMGMASGMLPRDGAALGSEVMMRAKDVSDAGAGGQVLMDKETFLMLKERIEELGSISAKGFQHKPASMPQAIMACCRRAVTSKAAQQPAVVLDMGCFLELKGQSQQSKRSAPGGQDGASSSSSVPIQATATALAAAAAQPGPHVAINVSPKEGGHDGQAPGSAPTSGEGGSRPPVLMVDRVSHGSSGPVPVPSILLQRDPSGKAALPPRPPAPTVVTNSTGGDDDEAPLTGMMSHARGSKLHLYQLLSPALVGRAKAFGNKLALPADSWRQIDKPYFSAPCAAAASLGDADAQVSGLSSMTMVFAKVEGGTDWNALHADREPDEAMRLHETILSIILTVLQDVPGGYLCRVQDGDLKYMVAFDSSTGAMGWCLAVQEAMMYADWSERILQHPKFRAVYGEDGALLFRGPRLKMGVCEGVPRAVLRDHLGRADYHGTSINQAARFMDAAAWGGQVACEEAWAMRTLQAASSGMGRGGSAVRLISITESEENSLNRDKAAAAAEEVKVSPPAAAGLPPHPPPPLPPASSFNSSRSSVTKVQGNRTGVYVFKGSAEKLVVLDMQLSAHSARVFPSEAPKGKGGRVGAASGVACEGLVALPGHRLIRSFKQRYEASERIRAEQGRPSPMMSPSPSTQRASLGQWMRDMGRSITMSRSPRTARRHQAELAAAQAHAAFGSSRGPGLSSPSPADGLGRTSLSRPSVPSVPEHDSPQPEITVELPEPLNRV